LFAKVPGRISVTRWGKDRKRANIIPIDEIVEKEERPKA
jgi:hypothetical protein